MTERHASFKIWHKTFYKIILDIIELCPSHLCRNSC